MLSWMKLKLYGVSLYPRNFILNVAWPEGTERNAQDLGTSFKMADNREGDHQILEAVHFAALKHKEQRRKDPEKTPYINHPIGVAYILWKEGGVHDTDVLQVHTDHKHRYFKLMR